MNPGTSNSATDVNHANAETSGIVSCDVHASSEAIRHLLILWLIWLFESFYISGFLCSALVLAVIMIRQEHAATRFWFCHTDRALMIWVCLSAVIQHGPLIAEAMQHKTAIRDHAGLSPLPGTRSGPAEKEYFGTRPLPTPCRNHLPRLSTSCSGERIIYEYEQKSQDCNIAPSNVWCLSIDDSHQCAGLGDEELGPLQTLLEESLAASDCPAMFLAHTLVETLVEHFAPQAPNTPIARPNVAWGPQPCRAALALEDLLPAQGPRRAHLWPRAFLFPAKGPILDEASPLHIASLSLGFSLDDARAFLAAETDLRDIQTLHACCLPHAMWSASALVTGIQPLRVACKPGEIVCYTDGSFTQGRADSAPLCGWACVFIDPHANRLSAALGACHSATCLSDSPSAYLGECAGLLAAALISTVAFQWQTVHFYSDCTSALAAAFGTASCALGGMAQTCNSAFCLRRVIGHVHDTHHYVPGHSNCFGNDLADALSKFGAKQSVPRSGLRLTAKQDAFWLGDGGKHLPWLGSVLRRLAGDNTLPPINTQCLGHDRWHGGLSPKQLLEPFLPPAIADETRDNIPHSEPIRLQMRLATFNTLSLHSREAGETGPCDQDTGLAFCPGRAQMLADQLLAHNVHAACLQETRCEQGFLRTNGYLRFCSGALKGQWGTEWWFREDHSFAVDANSGRPTSLFRTPLFTVIYRDPRRLLIRLVCGHFRLVFIGLHAPHRATERTLLEEWWLEC